MIAPLAQVTDIYGPLGLAPMLIATALLVLGLSGPPLQPILAILAPVGEPGVAAR